MFAEGDYVFYPKGGVFQIESLSEKKIANRRISCFDLVSSDGKTKISIPTQNIKRVGVRALLSTDQLDSSLEQWAPDPHIQKLHHKNRKNRFELFRQSGKFSEMGVVIVTIHKLISIGKATFEEKRIYEQVRKRIVDEISITKEMSNSEGEEFLMSELDQAILREGKSSLDSENGNETKKQTDDSQNNEKGN
ncbi:MAG: hypothetical protein CR997_01650 [Acidobacteria bacterium]|nr:MAG: hypothetical protein CR997_01650 [Acidobacteriota bacterium]